MLLFALRWYLSLATLVRFTAACGVGIILNPKSFRWCWRFPVFAVTVAQSPGCYAQKQIWRSHLRFDALSERCLQQVWKEPSDLTVVSPTLKYFGVFEPQACTSATTRSPRTGRRGLAWLGLAGLSVAGSGWVYRSILALFLARSCQLRLEYQPGKRKRRTLVLSRLPYPSSLFFSLPSPSLLPSSLRLAFPKPHVASLTARCCCCRRLFYWWWTKCHLGADSTVTSPPPALRSASPEF